MIGYYVHHQGRGHLHRAVCVARRLRVPVVGLSSLPRPAGWRGEWIPLPLDTDQAPDAPRDGNAPSAGRSEDGDDPTAGGRLHWAPRHHPGLCGRMEAITSWIDRARPRLFVSDVSVEVALLARLTGTPVVVAAMRGDRFDRAHRLGYDIADALLAPWPEAVPEPDWPQRWRAKTVYTGAFSRYDGRPRPGAGDRVPGRREVVVLLGGGGADVDAAALREAAASTTGWAWTFLGGPHGRWVDDPWPLLCGADAVITHAGQNAVAECAAARTPALVIPQDRPHGEQRATARALATAGLATVRMSWPAPREWQDLLDRTARRPGGRWAAWAPGDGAQRAARLLERLSGTAPCAPPRDLPRAVPGAVPQAGEGPCGSL
ncbi:glycosyl transferase [Streptomyces sp. p1417]|uniref:Glycosyl transferase n=1 Tax=Streptomyces typhae TaxID=2681492 RepID=A0A6L6X493_9ACTN|nr:glycosyl transferase [Streptomyces typhae]